MVGIFEGKVLNYVVPERGKVVEAVFPIGGLSLLRVGEGGGKMVNRERFS